MVRKCARVPFATHLRRGCRQDGIRPGERGAIRSDPIPRRRYIRRVLRVHGDAVKTNPEDRYIRFPRTVTRGPVLTRVIASEQKIAHLYDILYFYFVLSRPPPPSVSPKNVTCTLIVTVTAAAASREREKKKRRENSVKTRPERRRGGRTWPRLGAPGLKGYAARGRHNLLRALGFVRFPYILIRIYVSIICYTYYFFIRLLQEFLVN